MLAGGGSGFVNKTSVSIRAGEGIRLESTQEGNKFIFQVFSISAENKTLLMNSTGGGDGLGYYNETGLGSSKQAKTDSS